MGSQAGRQRHCRHERPPPACLRQALPATHLQVPVSPSISTAGPQTSPCQPPASLSRRASTHAPPSVLPSTMPGPPLRLAAALALLALAAAAAADTEHYGALWTAKHCRWPQRRYAAVSPCHVACKRSPYYARHCRPRGAPCTVLMRRLCTQPSPARPPAGCPTPACPPATTSLPQHQCAPACPGGGPCPTACGPPPAATPPPAARAWATARPGTRATRA